MSITHRYYGKIIIDGKKVSSFLKSYPFDVSDYETLYLTNSYLFSLSITKLFSYT